MALTRLPLLLVLRFLLVSHLCSAIEAGLPSSRHGRRCVFELNGETNAGKAVALGWRLANANGSIDIHSATAGRSVHLDLLAAGIIQDPDIGLNEGTARWVGEEPHWKYSARLPAGVSQGIDEQSRHLLHFAYIDTRATVHFAHDDGSEVQVKRTLQANNAHRRWSYDVTEHLQRKPSVIAVRLLSPIAYAAQEALNEPPYPTQNDVPSAPATQQYAYPHRNFIRKPSSDFGWDWGPAYADSGFGQVVLLRFDRNCVAPDADLYAPAIPGLPRMAVSKSMVLIDTALDVARRDQAWSINATFALYSAAQKRIDTVDVELAVDGTSTRCLTALSSPIRPGMNDDGRLWVNCTVPGASVKPWWPRGLRLPFGDSTGQHLYNVSFRLSTERGERLHWRVRTGFRTIHLDQHEYTAQEVQDQGVTPGSAFAFKIDGFAQPLPIVGSNLIPLSTFKLSAAEERDKIDYTLAALVASGQNMIRVWGGGSYGVDYLYEKAEELGILVWSEFAFACSLYPTYSTFLDNVKAEAREQVQRISRYASHALWAGNNEGELNMLPVATTYANGSIYQAQYELLFNEMLRAAARHHHPSSAYIPSSTTTGGIYPEGPDGKYIPRYRNYPPGEVHGNGEHYNYNASQALDTHTYPLSRFVNEFGMHSMADIRSFDQVATGPKDYHFNSTMARSRSKHSPPGNLSYPWPASDGQAQMTDGVATHFPIPRLPPSATQHSSRARRGLLTQWAYATQAFQALYVANQIGYYRLGINRPERNTGSLYWQLNSVWKAATDWASLEGDGRWKILHYLVARMYAETIAFVHHNRTTNVVEVHAISRAWTFVSGHVEMTWYDWTGNVLSRSDVRFEIPPLSSKMVATFPLGLHSDGPSTRTTKSPTAQEARVPTDRWLHVRLKKTGPGPHQSNEQFFSPASLRKVELKPASIVIKARRRRQVSTRPQRQGISEGGADVPQRPFGASSASSRQDDDDDGSKAGTQAEAGRNQPAPPTSTSSSLAFEISNEGEGVAPWVVLTHSSRLLRGWFVHDDEGTEKEQGTGAGGEPSNAFWLRPGERRRLRFQCYGGPCPAAASVEEDIEARSMWDSVALPND